MTIHIGEVISINGIKITMRIFEDSNKETLFYSGEKYKGVSIREYITIQRGFIDIVCIVEGEYLDENKSEIDGNKNFFIRKVDAKPVGYFQNNEFREGIKFMPMIKDPVFLLREDRIAEIFGRREDKDFIIGQLLKEELPISLPWDKIFNTHVGIFGNTGSGKSNTLAKLFTVLFDQKAESIEGKSKFVLLDFNGEYTADQLLPRDKKRTLILNTQIQAGDTTDKFPLSEKEFWSLETLSILFQASTSTQKPFLNRLINGKEKYSSNADSLLNYTKSIFKKVFSSASPKPECLDLLRIIAKIVKNDALLDKLKTIVWFTGNGDKKFRGPGGATEFYNADGVAYATYIDWLVQGMAVNVDAFEELTLRASIQLTNDLLTGFVQFDHIQPLLKRIDSSLASLKKVLLVSDEDNVEKILTVISLRKCNQEIKKVLPLLIAKHYYNHHKDTVEVPPNKTMHFIIDEAHNVLSEQSSRESEGWKDYRLELFEEIIKEGRKFGMFLTLSSQRPADISPTIVSQIHNFFIHRLVNDKDLLLLDNTISTLDRVSKSLIPNLSKGACVVTGTSFVLPMVIQVDILDKAKQPDSEDVDLKVLWA